MENLIYHQHNLNYSNLIIDANNLFWHCYLKDISKTISNIERTISFLYKFCNSNTKWYFLFDNPESKINIRKSIDKNYKHKREKRISPKGAYELLDLWKKMLLYSSDLYYVGYLQGYEADDLVKPTLEIIQNETLMVSSDLDWARNITENVDWCDWKNIYNPHDFENKYGFYPSANKIKLFKALKGDASDHIPVGCKRLPKNVLYAILDKCDTVLDLDQCNIPIKWKNAIKESIERIKINYNLVDYLPIPQKTKFLTECHNIPHLLDKIKMDNKCDIEIKLW